MASRTMASRTYADAVAALNTLQSNFAIVDAIRKSGKKMNEQSIPEMIGWARKLGYQVCNANADGADGADLDACVSLPLPAVTSREPPPSDFNSLQAIHIAGTKGKGSTAAYVASILSQFANNGDGPGPSKIGLYTSPHLRFVRERIQINGSPLSEDQFAAYFFETWDRLGMDRTSASASASAVQQPKLTYFRFLTLMALHAYKRENCDAAVIECGIGGEYDSTNIIQRPSVTAITSLGIDHVAVLGDTLGEIAWHKAGIMKAGARCYTPSSQRDEAKAVLDRVAAERGVELVYVPVTRELTTPSQRDSPPLLQADFQRTNASLAIAIAEDFLRQKGIVRPDRSLILRGIQSARWPGRCDVRPEPENSITWCLDGGHTLDSIQVAGQWFASRRKTATTAARSYLIFNQQTRDAASLARALAASAQSQNANPGHHPSRPFDTVIFCTNTTYKDSGFKPDHVSINTNKAEVDQLKVQKELAQVWAELDPSADVRVVKTIEEAIQLVRLLSGEQQAKEGEGEGEESTVLITGSLHLVGGALEVLEAEAERGEKSRSQVDEIAWR
ncbi:hypothetical protein DV738_g4079, partial [Chaetothyriales sp. CBS 135597]